MNLSVLIHIVLCVLLVSMAALQLNDPDPLLWVTVYLAVASMPVTQLLGYRLPKLYLITVGLAASCLLVSLPGFIEYLRSQDYASIVGDMVVSKPYVEAAREFLGVTIASVFLARYFDWHVSFTRW